MLLSVTLLLLVQRLGATTWQWVFQLCAQTQAALVTLLSVKTRVVEIQLVASTLRLARRLFAVPQAVRITLQLDIKRS
jgi:hypothetical protein